MYEFDKAHSRIGTSTTKWDRYVSRWQLEDVIPLWVADMDFDCLPDVSEAIIARAKHPIYGYTDVSEKVLDAIISWEKKTHGIDVLPSQIVMNTGVVYGFYTLIDMLVKPQEKVIVQTPVYGPFFNTPKTLHREVVYNPLKHDESGWHMDVADFEARLKEDSSIRMFILCNPHNPSGQCHTMEELTQVINLCAKYDVWVVSDEIHSNIIMPKQTHISALASNAKSDDHVIVLGSPTKTFNLAGLKISYAIVKDAKLAEEFAATAKASGLSSINIFAMEALVAAYTKGEAWNRECCAYILENFRYVKQYLTEHMPKVRFEIPQATYLAWLDFSQMGVPDDFVERLKLEGHVEFQGGAGFGAGFEQWLRVNCACPRSTLTQGLQRMEAWLKQNQLLSDE